MAEKIEFVEIPLQVDLDSLQAIVPITEFQAKIIKNNPKAKWKLVIEGYNAETPTKK